MANSCARHVFACSLRVTRLETDGSPAVGANNMYVSDALATIAIASNIEEGDEFVVKNGCGELCVNVKACDQLKRLDLTMGLCYPDPELLELLLEGSKLNTDGAAVGFAYPSLGETGCTDGVSVEWWSKRYDVGGSLDSTYPYEHYIAPKTFWVPTNRNFENGPVTVELTGFAIENDNWGNGPENDYHGTSDRSLQSLPEADLPTPTCGYQTVGAAS